MVLARFSAAWEAGAVGFEVGPGIVQVELGVAEVAPHGPCLEVGRVVALGLAGPDAGDVTLEGSVLTTEVCEDAIRLCNARVERSGLLGADNELVVGIEERLLADGSRSVSRSRPEGERAANWETRSWGRNWVRLSTWMLKPERRARTSLRGAGRLFTRHSPPGRAGSPGLGMAQSRRMVRSPPERVTIMVAWLAPCLMNSVRAALRPRTAGAPPRPRARAAMRVGFCLCRWHGIQNWRGGCS